MVGYKRKIIVKDSLIHFAALLVKVRAKILNGSMPKFIM